MHSEEGTMGKAASANFFRSGVKLSVIPKETIISDRFSYRYYYWGQGEKILAQGNVTFAELPKGGMSLEAMRPAFENGWGMWARFTPPGATEQKNVLLSLDDYGKTWGIRYKIPDKITVEVYRKYRKY